MDHESRRRSIRLKGYDYASNGAYFVTVCAHARQPLFEDSAQREILHRTWDDLQERFPGVFFDVSAVMPNHVHFVVWLNPVGAPPLWAPETRGQDGQGQALPLQTL